MILLCQQPIRQVDDPDSVIVAKGHFVQCQNDFLIVIPDIAQGYDFAGESFLGGHVGRPGSRWILFAQNHGVHLPDVVLIVEFLAAYVNKIPKSEYSVIFTRGNSEN